MADTSTVQDRRFALERWLTDVMPGATSITLSPFTSATSGFSNLTLFTELRWSGPTGSHLLELVLRVQPPGGGLFPDYDLRLQYDVMRSLADSPVPVPEAKWFIDDPDVLGAPAFLMQRVHGEVATGFRPGFHGHGLFFDATLTRRREMWLRAVDVMATLHTLDVGTLSLPPALGADDTPHDAIQKLLDVIEGHLAWVGNAPSVLFDALHFLRSHVPKPAVAALCWGDPRPGNIVYRDGDVAAVLDWELAHIGPPEGDLAYFLLVDEVVAELNDVPRLVGLPDAEETVAHYESRVRRPLQDMDFHRIMQALRMATMLAMTVRLSPPELTFPPDYLTNNVPTRRLAELLGTNS
jgi:aminoglycoside phosphotransferase (APT) family kinase protein